jgi:glycine/D-amino acid oxidase-like deaminating enzyme
LNRRKLLKNAVITGAGTATASAGVNFLAPTILPEEMVFETNRSYWAKISAPVNPSLNSDIEADVAVIGGGFTGLSAACFLRKNSPTKRVVLLEAKACGNGASGRNGAMVLTQTADRYMQLSDNPALDRKIYDFTVTNIDAMRAIALAGGIDCELETKGALQVCNTPENAAAAKSYAEKAPAMGIPVGFWSKEQTAAALGTSVYEGAYFDPHAGQIHPIKWVHALKAAAESTGAEIFENTPVLHIEEGPVHRVETSSGYRVRARSLVLATNAYSSKLGYLRRAVSPIHDYAGITAPIPESLLTEIGWTSRLPFNDCRTETYYLGITPDNRIHIGGGPVNYSFNNGVRDLADQQRAYETLQHELVRIFPKLAGVNFETTWGGVVDMSLDESPAVGWTGKHRNIFYAIGFSGHGVNLTSLFGRIIADLEAGKAEQWSWLPYLNRMPPYVVNEPFRWLGIQAALRYYRLTDPKNP